MHHKSCDSGKTRDYGPNLVDHIFSTNSVDEFENYNHIIPNVITAFALTYYLYKPHIL